MDSDPTRRTWLQRLRSIGPAWPLVMAAMSLPMVGLIVCVATASTWLGWFDGGAGSIVTFWLVGSLLAAYCLLPTHATSLSAGYLFGAWLGVTVAWLVVLLSAVIAFATWQRLCAARAVQALADRPRARAIHEALLGQGTRRTMWLITLLRLSPLMPFAFTNVLLAAFGVRPFVFLFATMVGITPRAVAVALIGAEFAELRHLDWDKVETPPWITILSVVATALVVVLIGRLSQRALRRALPPAHAGDGGVSVGDAAR
ncbi:MAG: VTT domain-containing protein [Planctomycetes bacterium]|nr:VTT domain-containing protein [Planctomycetota bacterium]